MSHKRKNLLDELNKLAPSEAEKLINQYAKSKNKSVPKSLVITYAHDIEKHLDTVTVSCPYCQSTNIIKKGKIQHGLQRYQCKSCCKKFTKLTNTILEKSPWSWNVWTKVLYEMLHFSSVDLIMNTLINEHYVVEITKQTELPPQFCSNFNYLYVTEKGNIKKIIDNYNIKRKTDVLIHIYQIATNSSIDGSVLEDHEECSNKLIRHCYKKKTNSSFMDYS